MSALSTDYLVASLPSIAFDSAAPMTWDAFAERCGGEEIVDGLLTDGGWHDLETELRNAMAEARGGADHCRAATGCSLYWRNRVSECFQEKDVMKRETLIDRVWWDAAGELTPASSPLGRGALATYAVRLKISIKRSKISKTNGNAVFDRLTL